MNESSKSHYLDMNRPGAGSSSSNEVATIPYSTFRTKIARAAKRSYASPSATGTEAKELVERNYGNGQNKEVSDVNDKFLVRHGSSGYARNVKAVNDAQDNIDMNNNSNKNQGSSMTFYGSVVLNKKTTRALNQPDGTPLYRRAMKNIVVDDSKLPADANSPVLSDKSKTLFSNNDKKSLNNGEIATQQSPEVSTLLTAYGKSIRRSYPVRGHYTKGLFNENGTKNEGSCDKDEENKAITKQFDGNDKLFNKSTSNMVRYSPTTTQATRVASSERVFIATSPLSSARFPFFTKHVVPTRSYQENNSDNSGIFRNSDNSSIFRKLDTNISTLANKSTRIDDTPEEQNNKDRTNVEGDDDITKKQNSNKPNENHCDSYCYHADDENAVTMKTIDKSKEEDQIRNYSMGELVLSEHSIEKTEAIMSPTKLLSSRSRSSLSVPDMHSENEYWNGSTAPSTKSVSTTTARITNNISPLNLHGTLSRDSDLFASISVDEELRCKDNSSGDPILSATSNAKTEEKEKQTQSKGYVLSPFSNRVTEQNGTTLFSLRSWTNSPTNNSFWNFNSLNNKAGKKSAVMIQKLDNLVQNITSEKSVESDETEEIVFMDNIEDSTPEAAANNSPTCSEIFIANQNSTSARTNAHVLYNICASASTVSDLRFAHSLINLDTASKIHGPKGKTALHAVSQNSELAKAIFKNKCDLLSSNNQNAIGRTSSPLNGIVSKGSHVSHQSNSSSSSSSYGRRISSEEEHLTEFIIDTLWNVYPAAMMTPDSKGNIPFEAALREWVNDSFERIIVGDNDHDNRANREQNVQERLPVFTNRNSSSILKSIKNTSTSIMKPSTDKLSQTVSTQGFDKHEKPLEDIEIGKRGDLEINEYNKDEASFADQPWRKLLVQLSPQALYCFSMLSSMISHMDGSIKASHRTNKVICRKKTTVNGSKNGFVATRSGRRQQSMSVLEVMTVEDLRASIIQSVASIPNIVMVVLLIDDENARKYIINTTLMQRVLASKHSIGTWLTAMLRSPAKAVSNRAIEYLQILSGPRFHFRNNGIDYSRSSTSFIGTENSIFGDGELCVVERIDKLQNRKILHTDDYNNSNNDAVLLQDDFYNKASHLPDFVPSLLSLGEKEIEEVSTTIVVRQVLDRIMARPFIVAVVFCDALFLILLIFGYHGAIQRLLLGTDGSVINYIYVANLGLFYFVVRELGKVISLYMISCCKARVYFGSFWNVADLLCIVLTLISIVLIRTYFLHPTLTINSDGDDDNNNNRNARMLMTTTDHNNIIENTATSTSTNSSIPNDYLPDGLRNLLAITTALLWLRVLNFLKGINTQLATFVLAIIQVKHHLHVHKTAIVFIMNDIHGMSSQYLLYATFFFCVVLFFFVWS